MDKRGIRYQQAERMTTAEGKVKRLRQENDDLRKQLFRATESARIANEEATARAVAQRQSGEALRKRLASLESVEATAIRLDEMRLSEIAHLKDRLALPLWRIAAQRLAARFGRSA